MNHNDLFLLDLIVEGLNDPNPKSDIDKYLTHLGIIWKINISHA